jgi:hypothetical protein
MANDLATLRTKLAVALSDPTFGYWTSAEMDDLVKDAVNNLWPRYARRVDGMTITIPLVEGTDFYTIPADVKEIDSIQWLDADGVFQDYLPDGSWLPTYDESGTARLQINESYAALGGSLRLSGLLAYNVTTSLIPDNLVDLVISLARAEAYRRALGDRMRFKQWATTNQIQNVSVNEMLGIINESERKAAELRSNTPRAQRRPVPARV